MLPMLFAMKEIDFNDTQNVFILRVVFAAVQVVLFSSLILILTRIRSCRDHSQLQVPVQSNFGESQPEGKTEVTTVEEYDMQQLRQLSLKVIVGGGIATFIHMKWGIIPPLFMQCAANPILMYNSQLCKIHIFGQNVEGPLQRPWKEEKPFEAFFGKNESSTGTSKRKEEKKRAKEEKKKKKT
jgi:hypothetical protein